jgi:TPR repeat protein
MAGLTLSCTRESPDVLYEKASATLNAGNSEMALKQFREACSAGHQGACVMIAILLPDNEAIAWTKTHADAWLQSCTKGDDHLCDYAGRQMFKTDSDSAKKALVMFDSACTRGSAKNCRDRAQAEITNKDDAAASHYYALGCDANDGFSCVQHAMLSYSDGHGKFRAELNKGGRLLEKECSTGSNESCTFLKDFQSNLKKAVGEGS